MGAEQPLQGAGNARAIDPGGDRIRKQIVLPAEPLEQDGVEAGQVFDVRRIDRGEYRLVRMEAPANEGLVDWLLSCPEKDYFVPVELESTDTL